jgi:DNA-binding NarL/FixJ family response regulator
LQDEFLKTIIQVLDGPALAVAGQGGAVTSSSGAHNPSSSRGVGRRVRVVIADDFPEVLDAVERRLEPKYEIVGRVSDGLALVESVGRLQPDILITDISMPGLTGIEALRRLRSLGINIPAVILSVHEDQELAKEAFLQGASGFVLKSRLEDDLQTAIEEALAGRTFISERLRRKLPGY